jgi:hypothetical protein
VQESAFEEAIGRTVCEATVIELWSGFSWWLERVSADVQSRSQSTFFEEVEPAIGHVWVAAASEQWSASSKVQALEICDAQEAVASERSAGSS